MRCLEKMIDERGGNVISTRCPKDSFGETRGYKMIDVIGNRYFMVFVRAENLSEKSV